MKKIAAYFAQGLLFLIPIAATIYVLYVLFQRVDQIFKFTIPGLGFVLTLALVTLIGVLASSVLARGAAGLVDTLFSRMPIGKMIYSSVRDLMNAFVGDRRQFNRPVLVNLMQGSSIQFMGFVTRESLEGVAGPDSVAVYIPQSFNFSGNVIIAPRDQITALDIESSNAMAFIVSGGVSGLQRTVGSGKQSAEPV
jgi:uncharacterized membrane protein